jgi:hypothetical protein
MWKYVGLSWIMNERKGEAVTSICKECASLLLVWEQYKEE